ncbi:MAG: hypothetical protein JW955_11480 [Sedimentisphaerales bacterium]|nr:hypothetical protein [Sedimentisphaerales bacterium]
MATTVSNIVFTMNRPLQLHAYLASLYACFPRDAMQTYVLYKRDKFDEQYEEVFSAFPHIRRVTEENFHDDLYDLLMDLETPYVLFGTDDVVYFDGVDLTLVEKAFHAYPQAVFGFSMRLDPATLPATNAYDRLEIDGQPVYRVNWKKAQDRTARYPFELDGTFYEAALVRRVLQPVATEHPFLRHLLFESPLARILQCFSSMKDLRAYCNTYHNPNTYEGYCYRWCKTHKRQLPPYLLFQRLCVSAIQVNRVNTTVENAVDGSEERTVEALNEKFRQGYRLDIGFLRDHKPRATHVGGEYLRLEQSGKRIG